MKASSAQFDDAAANAATSEQRCRANRLLTVREVAELLQVPVSWIYGHVCKRSRERLPGYRLGKYWRFSEDEILAWAKCHREDDRAARPQGDTFR
jgi:excisionase family DNA binding protein